MFEFLLTPYYAFLICLVHQSAALDTNDPACGVTKGCFTDGSSHLVSWTVDGTNALYTLVSDIPDTSGSWIAVAFSADTQMGNDGVNGCAFGSDRTVVTWSGVNGARSRPAPYTDPEVTLVSSSVNSSTLSCTIRRPIAASSDGRRVDVSNQWYLLFAKGSASVTSGQVSVNYHGPDNRWISSAKYNVSSMPGKQDQSAVLDTNDPACGVTKGCLTDDSSYLVSWKEDGTDAIYTLVSNIPSSGGSWIAVAFSADTQMGADGVNGCAFGSDGTVVTWSGVNGDESRPVPYTDPEVTLVSSNINGNTLSCTIRRPIAASSDGRRVDVSNQWYLLFAKGSATVTSGQVSVEYHGPDNRWISSAKYNVSSMPGKQDQSAVLDTNDPACGVTKGCLTDDSSYLVSWKEDGTDAIYTLVSNIPSSGGSWIAVAFSADTQMGADGVNGCAFGSDGTVVTWSGVNGDMSRPVPYTDPEVTLVSSNVNGNTLSCTIRRPIAASSDGRRVDISKQWYLLFARGSASVSNGQVSVEYHGSQGRWVSTAKYSASSIVRSGTQNQKSHLIKAHGSLMIAAWIFLASVGIVAARYYKPVWKNLMCSQKIWFQIHRTCMVLVFLLTAIGFIIIFIEIDGYSKIVDDRQYLEGHPIMGIIVMILTVLNPVMALFRPHPGTPRRPIFNWAHWFVGTAAHILAVITVFFGVLLERADAPDYLIYILAAYVAWQIFVELLLEMISCFGRKQAKSEMYEMNDSGGQQAAVPSGETEKVSLVKKIIFVVHVFVVTALAAVLIGLFAEGKANLED